MIPTKCRFIWKSGFRGNDFYKLANQIQELPVAAIFVGGSRRDEQSLQRTFHRCFLPCFRSFGQTVSEEKNLKNQPTRNKGPLWRSCLFTDRDAMRNNYKRSSIHASYQVAVYLGMRFQRRKCLKIDQSETRIAGGGHVC